MDYIRKNKVLTIVLVLMAAINLTTLGVLLLGNGGEQSSQNEIKGLHQPGPKPGDSFAQELGLDESQKARFEELRKELHQQVFQVDEQGRGLRDSLFGMLRNPHPDTVRVDSLTSLIAMQVKEKERLTFYHFAMVRELCSDKQRVIFDDIFEDVLKKMGPPPRPGRQGPPGRHHPPL